MTNLPTWLVITLTLAAPVAALLGVLLTLAYNLRNDKNRAKRERDAWIRQQQWDSYAELAGVSSFLMVLVNSQGKLVGNSGDVQRDRDDSRDIARLKLDYISRFMQAYESALLATPDDALRLRIRDAGAAVIRGLNADDVAATLAKTIIELRRALQPVTKSEASPVG